MFANHDNLDKYMSAVKRTWNSSAGMVGAVLGLVGETGEVVELIKKSKFHGKMYDLDKFEEEIGDVFYYLYALCDELIIDPAIVMAKNIAKLEKRYPNGFVLGGGIREQ